jgi:predicted enzyme related to lactoylglutathione lyase
MGENNAAMPGTFCWADLGTSDAGAAKNFYSRLFGWSIFETGAGETAYTMFQIDGKDVVAIYSLNEKQRAQGIPPHWVPYVSVENAEESAAKAWELGGKLLLGAFDVEGHGRMALIEDPTGATFAVWQPLKHSGSAHLNQIGGMCWHELVMRDHETARKFYTGLFGWGTQLMDVGSTVYTTFTRSDGSQAGGLFQMSEEWGDIPPHWMIYFSVEDCDASSAKAKDLGGEVYVPPTDIPPVGRFSVIRDPQGATFSVIKLSS